ncbi:MAG TPA: hypothetical protein VLA19_00225 [Herpetosiphonaceae bacterium]|nr:hypothetical protein [Herpetosiphonaceae bacterium]
MMRSGVGDPSWSGYRRGAWAVLAALGLLAVVALANRAWLDALTLAGFAIGAGVFMRVLRRLPPLVHLMLVLAALVNAVGYASDLWQRIALFDDAVHGFTIFALTLPLGLLSSGSRLTLRQGRRFEYVLVVASFGIAVGALWEVAEWAFDLVQPSNVIQGKTDTIIDIIMDTIGALLAAGLSGWIVLTTDDPVAWSATQPDGA